MASPEELVDERTRTHGDFRRQATATDAIKSGIFSNWEGDLDNPVISEALIMMSHKLGRIAAGDAEFTDHWRDIAGYATLVVQEIHRQKLIDERAFAEDGDRDRLLRGSAEDERSNMEWLFSDTFEIHVSREALSDIAAALTRNEAKLEALERLISEHVSELQINDEAITKRHREMSTALTSNSTFIADYGNRLANIDKRINEIERDLGAHKAHMIAHGTDGTALPHTLSGQREDINRNIGRIAELRQQVAGLKARERNG